MNDVFKRLHSMSRRRNILMRFLKRTSKPMFLCLFAILITEIYFFQRPSFFILLVAVYGSLLTLIALLLTPSRAEKLLVAQVAQIDDVRVIGNLAEALEFGDRHVYLVAAAALKRTLPKLINSSESSKLSDYQVECLCHNLGSYDTKLVITIMEYFEWIGEERAKPWMQQLSEGKTVSYKWYWRPARSIIISNSGSMQDRRHLQQLAQSYLATLHQRMDRKIQPETLLRSGDVPHDELLRPLPNAVNEDSNLLHPMDKDAE